MATDLNDFLTAQIGDTPFQPYHEISPEADALTFYFRADADYSQRLPLAGLRQSVQLACREA